MKAVYLLLLVYYTGYDSSKSPEIHGMVGGSEAMHGFPESQSGPPSQHLQVLTHPGAPQAFITQAQGITLLATNERTELISSSLLKFLRDQEVGLKGPTLSNDQSQS